MVAQRRVQTGAVELSMVGMEDLYVTDFLYSSQCYDQLHHSKQNKEEAGKSITVCFACCFISFMKMPEFIFPFI